MTDTSASHMTDCPVNVVYDEEYEVAEHVQTSTTVVLSEIFCCYSYVHSALD